MTYTSEQYNDVLRSTAAELQALHIATAAELKAKDEAHAEAITLLKAEHTKAIKAASDASQAKIDALTADLAAANAAKDEVITALDDMDAYRLAMVAKVSAALQSGDPAQFAALAVEFLTPEEEKARAEKLAKIAELKAQAAALESELA